MTYQPSSSPQEELRRLFSRRVRDSAFAVLGNTSGLGARVDVVGLAGYVYVRFPNGADAAGNVAYTSPTIARSAGVAFPNVPGAGVYVAYGDNNELEIKSAHYAGLDLMGINTSILNPLNQQSKFVYPWQLTYGLANAVGNATTPSTLITIKKIRHYTGSNLLQPFDTPLAADKPDLASYIPATDMHCYAMVWLDTYLNVASVTTSVAQAITAPLVDADLQECVVRSVSSRPPDGIPFKAFYLSNDQGSISQNALDVDVRQWLDMPNVLGFPNILTTLERVRAGYTFVTGPFTTSGVGDLDTSETGANVIVVHKNNTTNTAPTGTDDSDSGYSVGSMWFDTATSTLYVASDVSVGVAVWDAVGGGGSFAPDDATYLLQVANGSLPNAQAMGALGTGLVKNTTGTGVQSIAVANTDYVPPTGAILTSPTINTSISGTAISDDATFASPSSTTIPTTNAVKGFVDQTVLGLNAKADVRLATAAALPALIYANGSSGVGATLTAVSVGVLTIDGVTVALNDRLLIKDQAAGLQNGIYKCTVAGAIGVAFVLTRTADGDTDTELRGGWMVVIEGTVNSTQAFVNTNVSAITFGTTAITFGEFSAGVITAVAPLSRTGNAISHNDTAVSPGSYTNASLTVDQKGHLTAASSGTAPVNPPFVDTQTIIKGSADASKLARFEVDGFTTSTTRVMTLPNYDATLSPMTTAGDTTYHNGTDNVRLAKGTALQHLRMNAGATAPEWAAGMTIDFHAVTTSGAGTWTKPAGCVFVDVICVAAGGGGGGGRRSTAASIRGGGGGGAGGSVTRMQWSADQLGSSESFNVGTGGTGGAAPVVDNNNGGDGNPGGPTFFGGTTSGNCKLIASGGSGGIGGGVSVGGAGGAGQTTLSNTYQFYNAGGGTGGTTGTPTAPLNPQWGPGNGGGGGGINGSGTAFNAAAGSSGSAPAYGVATAGGGGTAGTTGGSGTGGNGAAGTLTGASVAIFGAGGGGGAPVSNVGQSGGTGGLPGGGGGGGGATLNGSTGFPGGGGADGCVIVISYCY